MAAHLNVAQAVGGSNPLDHPIYFELLNHFRDKRSRDEFQKKSLHNKKTYRMSHLSHFYADRAIIDPSFT